MATARVTPRNEAVWTINFQFNGSTLTVSSPALKGVQAGDVVNFTNSTSSTAPIVITLAANPPGPAVFTDSSISVAPGVTTGETALPANGSVNYTVSAAGQTFGPYAVQVGNGPLYVQVNNSITTPDQVAIPVTGSLEVYSTDGSTYSVLWTNLGDPFEPPLPGLTHVYPLSDPRTKPYTEQKAVANYNYQLTKTGPVGLTIPQHPIVGAGGGGRVIVTG